DSRSTFDLIICFDTIEQLANPSQFLQECQRLLTPGGRFVGSIITEAADAATANEHHLHIFTRPVFEQLCRKYFEIELVRGQTAATIAPAAAIWKADDSERTADSWIVVGLTDPFLSRNLEFRHGLMPPGAHAGSDPLIYNPLLATKTVSAAWLLGWIALQGGDLERARAWWTNGIAGAERALQRPWEELMVSWSSPLIFGLRDATVIIDMASQCAV